MSGDRVDGSSGRPGSGLTLVGAFLCASLAMSGAAALFDGLTTGSFGWVRNFGAVALDARPVAFAAVALMYVAGTVATGWGSFKLVGRVRGRRGG